MSLSALVSNGRIWATASRKKWRMLTSSSDAAAEAEAGTLTAGSTDTETRCCRSTQRNCTIAVPAAATARGRDGGGGGSGGGRLGVALVCCSRGLSGLRPGVCCRCCIGGDARGEPLMVSRHRRQRLSADDSFDATPRLNQERQHGQTQTLIGMYTRTFNKPCRYGNG